MSSSRAKGLKVMFLIVLHQILIVCTGTATQHCGCNFSTTFICQVETVGQVYMAVSGAPEYTPQHAENVADVALCLLRQVKLPSGISIQIRIGEFLRLRCPLDRPLHFIRMSPRMALSWLIKQYKISEDKVCSVNISTTLLTKGVHCRRFCNMTLSKGVIGSRRFKRTYCLHLQGPISPPKFKFIVSSVLLILQLISRINTMSKFLINVARGVEICEFLIQN